MAFSPPSLEPRDFLSTLERNSNDLVRCVHGRGVVTIENCAPWTTLDLVRHLGQVCDMVDETVASGTREPLRPSATPPEVSGSPTETLNHLVQWFDDKRQKMLRTLAAADPDTPVWTWGPPSTVRFYMRRLTHEMAVHLLDVDPTCALDDSELDRHIIVDGIEEFLTVILPRAIARRSKSAPTSSLHLHCTDGPGEWLVTVSSSGDIDVRHEHAKGDVAWRGTALDLFAAIWGRHPPSVEVLGDLEMARHWSAVAP